MEKVPNERLLRSALGPGLADNIAALQTLFNAPLNKDLVVRRFETCGFSAALLYIEGMAGSQALGEGVLRPCLTAPPAPELPAQERTNHLAQAVLSLAGTASSDLMSELVQALLDGQSALLAEGCGQALILETRGYEKRGVERPQNESVVIGAQQGFVENLRTNITLIRRVVRSPMLITEMLQVGCQIPSQVALVYLKGVASQPILEEVRRRILSLKVDYLTDSGQLQAFIEDAPMQLIPQMLQTERPDRAAHCVCDGQIAILMDNSPYALIAPITFFHLIHAADDNYLRWQYATFTRLLRTLGLLMSLYLPGLYVALTTFHRQVIPLDLLTSIAESRARVPFPVLVETLILELSFFMINEAGIRMSSQIGSALGIVGGLILGQAAVAADVISPILIIIVALSGLGNYVAPTYSLSIVVEILRLSLVLIAALAGLYGIALLSFVYLCALCAAQSLGQPMMAPFAPYRPHNPDLLLRLPAWLQKRRLFLASRASWLKRWRPGDARSWRKGDKK